MAIFGGIVMALSLGAMALFGRSQDVAPAVRLYVGIIEGGVFGGSCLCGMFAGVNDHSHTGINPIVVGALLGAVFGGVFASWRWGGARRSKDWSKWE